MTKATKLSITRKVGECITVGDDVVMEVLEIRGQQVRLRFTAPPSVQIWRQELKPELPEPEAS